MVSSLRGPPVASFPAGFVKQYSWPGFDWIYLDWLGFAWIGGLVNPGLETVIALFDELLAECGGSSRDVSVLGHKLPWVRVEFLHGGQSVILAHKDGKIFVFAFIWLDLPWFASPEALLAAFLHDRVVAPFWHRPSTES